MREAYKGYRSVTPHVEYRNKMCRSTSASARSNFIICKTSTVKRIPQLATAGAGGLFTAAAVGVKRFGNHRPLVSIPDTLSGINMMKALNPEVVIPGHGDPGTAKILNDMESYYTKMIGRRAANGAAGAILKRGPERAEDPRHRRLGRPGSPSPIISKRLIAG